MRTWFHCKKIRIMISLQLHFWSCKAVGWIPDGQTTPQRWSNKTKNIQNRCIYTYTYTYKLCCSEFFLIVEKAESSMLASYISDASIWQKSLAAVKEEKRSSGLGGKNPLSSSSSFWPSIPQLIKITSIITSTVTIKSSRRGCQVVWVGGHYKKNTDHDDLHQNYPGHYKRILGKGRSGSPTALKQVGWGTWLGKGWHQPPEKLIVTLVGALDWSDSCSWWLGSVCHRHDWSLLITRLLEGTIQILWKYRTNKNTNTIQQHLPSLEVKQAVDILIVNCGNTQEMNLTDKLALLEILGPRRKIMEANVGNIVSRVFTSLF